MKLSLRLFGACCALSIAAVSYAAPAKKSTVKPTGPVSIDYKHFEYSPSELHLFGGVHMDSAQYIVDAGDVVVEQTSGQSNTFKRATALPLAGKQVSMTFQEIVEAKSPKPLADKAAIVPETRSLKTLADKAVIVPEPSRPGGARIDLTGNVVLDMTDPGALNGPSKTTLETATILLGDGPTYPRIEGEHGHTTLTPQF